MIRLPFTLLVLLVAFLAPLPPPTAGVVVSGEVRQWHKVTLTIDGPFARERDARPNPFLDYRLTVRFRHESGTPSYDVPGYFAADGNAGETSAEEGTKWRAHLSPDEARSLDLARVVREGASRRGRPEGDGRGGRRRGWRRRELRRPPHRQDGPRLPGAREAAVRGRPLPALRPAAAPSFSRPARTRRRRSSPSPDFDGTVATKKEAPLKTWVAPRRDFRPGDPTWKGGKGKGLVGALDYLASRGANAFSFLTYNAGGDGDKRVALRRTGLEAPLRLLEARPVAGRLRPRAVARPLPALQDPGDGERRPAAHPRAHARDRPEALDGGAVGVERRLYYRELVARFGYLLALNWNLGEENHQTPAEQRAMAEAFRELDPYGHLRVIHTHPGDQDVVYTPLLGEGSSLTGASLQNHWTTPTSGS